MRRNILLVLTLCIAFGIGCESELDLKRSELYPLVSRNCPGDFIYILLGRGKCKNDCERGWSVKCGGVKVVSRCGEVTISHPTCDEAFSQNVNWVSMEEMLDQDTADAVLVRIEFLDLYTAKFVFLEDISDDLVEEPDFTITNNTRWVDQIGFTFGQSTLYNFQFIGNDYQIQTSDDCPLGYALVDMVAY